MRIRALVLPTGATVAVAVVALALTSGHHRGSSGSRATGAVIAGAGAVMIRNYAFAPQTLTVKVGTRVTWTNRDATAHTATMDQGVLDTGTISPGQSKAVDFTRPGTYAYHCAFHAFMTGTIRVVR